MTDFEEIFLTFPKSKNHLNGTKPYKETREEKFNYGSQIV
jgi:hypothetical protein